MDIKQLKYFVTIVKAKSFSKAAKRLFVSQSAMSKAMQGLEAELGIKLIYFSGKNMHVTPYGAQLYNMAVNLIEQHEMIIDTMHDISHLNKGTLKIGVPPIIGTCVFPMFAAEFIEKYPAIDLIIDQHEAKEIKEMIHNRVLDLGFTLLPTDEEVFDILPIVKSRHVVMTSPKHPLANCQGLRYADLRNEKFIMLGEEYVLYNNLMAGARLAGFEPNIIMRLSSWDLVLKLVMMNMGITILPLPLLSIFSGIELSAISLDESANEWDVALISLKDSYESLSAKAFKEHVKEVLMTGIFD